MRMHVSIMLLIAATALAGCESRQAAQARIEAAEASHVRYLCRANRSSAMHQFLLGEHYREGHRIRKEQYCFIGIVCHHEIVRKDRLEAYKWLSLAAENGQPLAQTSRDILSNKMNADQIAEGEKLVREWKPDLSWCEAE